MKNSTICLWFNGQAQDAARFYTEIFPDGKLHDEVFNKEAGPSPNENKALTVTFSLGGINYLALNGGPQYNFTPAVSIMVNCEDQKEIDYFWERLTEGGKEIACGWLVDKFGLSWQIVPRQLESLMKSKEPEKAERVMKALMQMVKLDLAKLENA